jgi:D-glycero-D-manno-heptose 1,7-bisphosphate phosphatase
MRERPALIILDRDGVLNETLHRPRAARAESLLRPEDVVVFPWVPALLRRLTSAGYVMAVASNQPAHAQGMASLETLRRVHERVLSDAQREGGIIGSSHICFHRAEDRCECRKPKSGLLLEALASYPLLRRADAWMVGDRATDVLAGIAAGVKTALVGDSTGLERQALLARSVQPDFCGDDLRDFVRFLLATAPRPK